jgi:dolichol-phosphate mannosyltransferase
MNDEAPDEMSDEPIATSTDASAATLSARERALVACPSGPLVVELASRPGLKLSLVIPTFNEARNIGQLVRELTDLLDPALGETYELIVIDDDSADRTWEAALSLVPQHPRLRVIRRRGERGLSTAVVRGWQVAGGEILAVIDADLQHPPDVVLRLLAAIEDGADLVVGSRHVDGGGVSDWSLFRRLTSRGAQLLGLALLPGVVGRVSDPMSGYFMLRRTAIAGIELSPLGYKILIECLGRGRARTTTEVGYVFRERSEGESKVTWRLYLAYVRHLLRLRFATFPLGRFLRFALVGTSGVVVDMLTLYLLSDPTTLGLGLTRSKIVAAELAIANNFAWNDAWTFRDMVGRQKGLRFKLRRFLKFNVVCSLGMLLNIVLLNFQFNVLHVNRYVANLVAIAIVTFWNFWLNLKMSWRASVPPTDNASRR